MKTPYDKLAKIYTNCSGPMTKMAATPYIVKTLLKIFSRTRMLMTYTKFAHMKILGWPWPTLQQGQIWCIVHLVWKNIEIVIFPY